MIWNTAKLGDVCFIQSGNSIAAKKKTELFTNVVGTPYIATKDVDFNGSINYKNGMLKTHCYCRLLTFIYEREKCLS